MCDAPDLHEYLRCHGTLVRGMALNGYVQFRKSRLISRERMLSKCEQKEVERAWSFKQVDW
jgi:hypothetical protein